MEKTIQQIVSDRDAADLSLRAAQELQNAITARPQIMTEIRDALDVDDARAREIESGLRSSVSALFEYGRLLDALMSETRVPFPPARTS